MPRKVKTIGNDLPSPSSKHQVLGTVFLVQEGTSTGIYTFNFEDGSIIYFENEIKQSFEYLLVDNIGEGRVRFAFNKIGLPLVSSIDGAKTLRAGDSLYIQDFVRNITLFFIESSIVELVLMSK